MSSTCRSEWQALAAQIEGLLEAARLFYASRVPGTTEVGPVKQVIVPFSDCVYDALEDYNRRAAGLLPERAANRLSQFFESDGKVFRNGAALQRVEFRLAAAG